MVNIQVIRTSSFTRFSALILIVLFLFGITSCGRFQTYQIDKAIKDGNVQEVEALLKSNPSLIFSTNNEGDTLLYLAAVNEHTDVVKLLLSKNVDINAKNNYGNTPLIGVLTHYEEDSNDLHIAELLLAQGANVNVENNDGMRSLDFAAENDSAQAIAKLLLANKANIGSPGSPGWTPLHLAASYGNTNVASLLLAYGAKVDAMTDDGRTPLHVAAQMGKKDMVELLLTNGANVNAEATNGWTPLHFATHNDLKDVAEFLRGHGGH